MTGEFGGSTKGSEAKGVCATDDGLETPDVGAWAEKKYKLVSMYDKLFTDSLKKGWKRVYIDLFAGAGKARIRNSRTILDGSPLLALSIPNRFDKYIFCEEKKALLDALKARVSADYPDVDVSYVEGDCNEKVNEIMALIPKYSRTNKVLSFCFVDPFSLNIEFKTIKKLSSVFMDFLILLAFSDASRNERIYVKEGNDRIEHFLGEPDWRKKWAIEMKRGETFVRFLEKEYINQMASLGYPSDSKKLMIEVRSDDKNLSLYHLAFFSRDELGYKFWREVQKYALAQTQLSLDV